MKRYLLDQITQWRAELRAGDRVFVTGSLYTARDAAHKRIFRLLDSGETPPFALRGAIFYYAGPTEAPPGAVIGSCGPTTSSRMDRFTPRLLDLGLAGMIGKGQRSAEVKRSIVKNGAVYFCAIGGAGALASRCVKSAEVVAFEDLGCESVKRLFVEDFPLYCANDIYGNDIYER